MAFLVFEGLDGSGKSTLIKELSSHLSSQGINYLVTREPGGTQLGNELRTILIRKNNHIEIPTARTELLLYEAIRSQHVEITIKPFLLQNGWVLCDRFTASSIAFQAGGRHLSLSDVKWLNRFATCGLCCDLTVFLDLPIKEVQKRCHNRHQQNGVKPDRFELEDQQFYKNVRDAYLEEINREPTKWLVLDATQSVSRLKQILISRLVKEKWLQNSNLKDQNHKESTQ